jgi:deoxyinosine 3'endonuclease (endonuclease V)
MLRGRSDPDWPELIKCQKQTQLSLTKKKMRIQPLDPLPRFGADAAFSEDKQKVLAAAVVYNSFEKRIVEIVHASRPIEFPTSPPSSASAKLRP